MTEMLLDKGGLEFDFRILFISKVLNFGEHVGGQYNLTIGWYKALERFGSNVWILHHNNKCRYSAKGRDIILPSIINRSDLLLFGYRTAMYPHILKTIRPQIVHVADESITGTTLLTSDIIKVATITDVIPLILPRLFNLRFKLSLTVFSKIVARTFDKIITISYSAADELVKLCRIPYSKIAVAYPAVDPIFRPLPKDFCRKFVKEKYGLKTPYLLYVGGTAPNKNVPRLLKSYEILKEKFSEELTLVLATLNETVIHNRDRVNTLPCIYHRDLPYVYSAAEALVFPSLAEGFGLPPVEAMACGTPVIVSNIPVFREVLGDAALYVNPFDCKEMAMAMEHLVDDKNLACELRLKGLQRANRYSLDRVAMKLIDIYCSIKKESELGAR